METQKNNLFKENQDLKSEQVQQINFSYSDLLSPAYDAYNN